MTIETFYDGKTHSILSNFNMLCPFVAKAWGWDDHDVLHWKSSEHYYQAAKCVNWDDVLRICDLETPGETKREGNKRTLKIRPDWDEVKIEVMRKALSYKFRLGTPAADFLLSTKGHVLIEGNNWDDTFWGKVRGRGGKNWLGWLLQAQRDWLLCQVEQQGKLFE